MDTPFFLSPVLSNNNPRNCGSDMLITYFYIHQRITFKITFTQNHLLYHQQCTPTILGGILGYPPYKEQNRNPLSAGSRFSMLTLTTQQNACFGVTLYGREWEVRSFKPYHTFLRRHHFLSASADPLPVFGSINKRLFRNPVLESLHLSQAIN